MKTEDQNHLSRRNFLQGIGGAGVFLGAVGIPGHAAAVEAPTDETGKVIPGFEKGQVDPNASGKWEPFSDRKVRVGIAGYGFCMSSNGQSIRSLP